MSDYKLVPLPPTPEMVSAAEDAYMPFGDMEMAIRMAVLAAPAVQGEPVAIVCNFSEGSGPQPTFVEAEVGGKSVSFEWRDRPDGLKEMLVPQSITPDVSRLVEALELIEKGEDTGPDGWGAFRWADCRNIARAALADHRKQGGEV